MCHVTLDHGEVQQSRKSRGSDKVQVCKAAGQCLARQNVWWLQSQLEKVRSGQHHAIPSLTTIPGHMTEQSLQTAQLLLMTGSMAPPLQATPYFFLLTPPHMAALPHHRQTGSSPHAQGCPCLVLNPDMELPPWHHLQLFPRWAIFSSFPCGVHWFSCHPQSGQEWLTDPGGLPPWLHHKSGYILRAMPTLPQGGGTGIILPLLCKVS